MNDTGGRSDAGHGVGRHADLRPHGLDMIRYLTEKEEDLGIAPFIKALTCLELGVGIGNDPVYTCLHQPGGRKAVDRENVSKRIFPWCDFIGYHDSSLHGGPQEYTHPQCADQQRGYFTKQMVGDAFKNKQAADKSDADARQIKQVLFQAAQ